MVLLSRVTCIIQRIGSRLTLLMIALPRLCASGSITKDVSKAFQKDARDLYHVECLGRQLKSQILPKMAANEGKHIGKGRQRLGIPSGRRQKQGVAFKEFLGQQSHHRKQAKECWGDARNGFGGPLTFGFQHPGEYALAGKWFPSANDA